MCTPQRQLGQGLGSPSVAQLLGAGPSLFHLCQHAKASHGQGTMPLPWPGNPPSAGRLPKAHLDDDASLLSTSGPLSPSARHENWLVPSWSPVPSLSLSPEDSGYSKTLQRMLEPTRARYTGGPSPRGRWFTTAGALGLQRADLPACATPRPNGSWHCLQALAATQLLGRFFFLGESWWAGRARHQARSPAQVQGSPGRTHWSCPPGLSPGLVSPSRQQRSPAQVQHRAVPRPKLQSFC